MVALEVLFSLRKGKKASKLLNVFDPMPLMLENVIVKNKNIVSCSLPISAYLMIVLSREREITKTKSWNS